MYFDTFSFDNKNAKESLRKMQMGRKEDIQRLKRKKLLARPNKRLASFCKMVYRASIHQKIIRTTKFSIDV